MLRVRIDSFLSYIYMILVLICQREKAHSTFPEVFVRTAALSKSCRRNIIRMTTSGPAHESDFGSIRDSLF